VGGLANDITGGAEYAFIGGGSCNTNSGYGAFIGGGGYDGTTSAGNQVKANASAIVGGLGNQILGNAPYAFIGGGNFNTNSGQSATVSGGNSNTASGDYSMIPGGQANVAQGKYSFAGGFGAIAANNGCFLWADNHNFEVTTLVPNLFAARCTGGVIFVTGIDGTGNPTAGVSVASGGNSWSSVSDRNAKKNFQPLNTLAVLNKLATIPIEQWNYKWEADTNTPNIGPMAQDFKAAFYPGRDDKSISTLEFDGVELAAIQGLNEKVEQLNAER
jgi:hypothetical protein